jgi:hypothetical protein
MMPFRYRQAPDAKARQKLVWMRDYINNSAVEHGLPDHFQLSPLPNPSFP